MFDMAGVYEGVEWSVNYSGSKSFDITFGETTEKFECVYEPVSDLHPDDVVAINKKLDQMYTNLVANTAK